MVTLSRLFQWFKIFDVDNLEFTADSLDPLAEERESIDSLSPCNLGPSCIQEKHRNIKIHVHLRTDVVNLPLIVKQKSCLPCHPSYKSITSTWVLNLHSTSQNSVLSFPFFFFVKQLYQKLHKLHKLSDTLAAQPSTYAPQNIRYNIVTSVSFVTEHPESQNNSQNAIWTDVTRNWCHQQCLEHGRKQINM